MRWISTHHLDRTARQIAALVALAALLYVAAGIGMAYVAGFDAVQRRLAHAAWWWLAPCFGAVVLGLTGYYLAYRGLARAEDGPRIAPSALFSVVIAGFGGFLAHGATDIDQFAMRAGGADERETKVRVSALAGFEHGVLALIVCPAAIVALALGTSHPRPSYTWPWAVIPPLGFALAIWLGARYRERLRERAGWRGHLGVFLDSIGVVVQVMRSPVRHGNALLGMAIFWAADMFALWAAIAAFGLRVSVLTLIVCVGTGMVFTRRTGPLGGVGVILVALTAALWNGGGVPFAVGTLAVALHTFFTFWIPLPAALLVLPKLRELQAHAQAAPAGQTEPALQL